MNTKQEEIKKAIENVRETMENPQEPKDFIKLAACLTDLQTCTVNTKNMK